MIIKHGNGNTEFGPGVNIELTGGEVATAIAAWLGALNVHVFGPHTITVNGNLCENGLVYVDSSGFVIALGTKISGRGPVMPDQYLVSAELQHCKPEDHP